MTRVRVSTTVEQSLWNDARSAHGGPTDSSVLEAALRALMHTYRSAQIDADYDDAYSRMPLSEPDARGDLETWRTQAGAS